MKGVHISTMCAAIVVIVAIVAYHLGGGGKCHENQGAAGAGAAAVQVDATVAAQIEHAKLLQCLRGNKTIRQCVEQGTRRRDL